MAMSSAMWVNERVPTNLRIEALSGGDSVPAFRMCRAFTNAGVTDSRIADGGGVIDLAVGDRQIGASMKGMNSGVSDSRISR